MALRPTLLAVPSAVPVLATLAGMSAGLSVYESSGVLYGTALVLVAAAALLGTRLRGLGIAVAFFILGLARGGQASPSALPVPVDSAALFEVLVLDSRGREMSVLVQGIHRPGPTPGRTEPIVSYQWPARLVLPSAGIGGGPQRSERWLVFGTLALSPFGNRVPPRLRPASAASMVQLARTGPVGWRTRVHGFLTSGLESFRKSVRQVITEGATPRTRGVLLALVLGDRQGIPSSLRDRFARAGTSHLLALSGLHVGSCLLALRWLLRCMAVRVPRACLPRQGSDGIVDRLCWALALLGAGGYIMLAGSPVSARRAWAMWAMVCLGGLLRRRGLQASGLWAAALAVGWLAPSSIGTLGFQLSIVSVAALLMIRPLNTSGGRARGSAWLAGPLRLVRTTCVASLATTAATAPLCAATWGVVAVSGLWANVLAIPLLGLGTVPPLLLGAASSLFWGDLAVLWVRIASLPAELGLVWIEWVGDPSRAPLLALALPPEGAIAVYGVLVALMLLRSVR